MKLNCKKIWNVFWTIVPLPCRFFLKHVGVKFSLFFSLSIGLMKLVSHGKIHFHLIIMNICPEKVSSCHYILKKFVVSAPYTVIHYNNIQNQFFQYVLVGIVLYVKTT